MTRNHSKLEQTVAGLHCAAVSDIGMRRASNQDSYAVSLAKNAEIWRSRGHLLVVADGMGAHAAGELASRMATDTIPHSYAKQHDLSPDEALASAVRDANHVINAKGQDSVDFHGMGTTCSCLLLLPCGALAAHVGDSRVYRLREHSLEQLTFDHSLVWELAAAGQANEEDVPAYVPKNVITRSLGPNPTVNIDIEGPFPLRQGDRFLLCSDGLTGPLSNELIGMVVATLPANEAAQTLVDLANLLGGPDNITVVVAEVNDLKQLGNGQSYELDSIGNSSDANQSVGQSSGNQSSGDSKNWLVVGTVLLTLVCVVMLGVFAFLGETSWWGVGVGAVWCAWIVILLRRKFAKPQAAEEIPVNGRHGKGPYRRYACQPRAENIESLSDIVRQLEDLEDQHDWQFDWQEIQTSRHQAHQAIARGDFDAAVVAYCRAVRRLMAALRENGPQPDGDSSIRLG